MKPGFYGAPETKWLTVDEIKSIGLDEEKSYAYLLSPLHYQPKWGEMITVPAGYITDFASVPRIFWSIFPPYDPYYGAPAIIHDFGYSTKGTFLKEGQHKTRKEVDDLFLEAMQVQETPNWKSATMYLSVRVAGWYVWNRKHELSKDWFGK